jgi:hypothetical protein
MGVTSIKLLFTSRGGKDDFEKHRTYKRVYEVLTDDPTDDENVIGPAMVAAGYGLGTSFDRDLLARLVGMEPEQDDESPTRWLVTLDYDTKPKLPSSVDPSTGSTSDPTSTNIDDPLAMPAQWRFASVDTEEPLTEWRPVNPDGTILFTNPDNWAPTTAYKLGRYVQNGGNVYRCVVAGTSAGAGGPLGQNPGADGTVTWAFWDSLTNVLADPNAALLVAVANSGGYPFDPPQMETVSKPMIQVTKNVAVLTLAYLMGIKNAVNVVPWKGIPARCAKVMTVEAESKFEKNLAFMTGTWHIGLDPETWDKRILDSGWGAKKTIPNPTPPGGTTTGFVEFTDETGQPYGAPVPMNGVGGKLTPGDPPVYLRGVSRQTKLVDLNALLPF